MRFSKVWSRKQDCISVPIHEGGMCIWLVICRSGSKWTIFSMGEKRHWVLWLRPWSGVCLGCCHLSTLLTIALQGKSLSLQALELQAKRFSGFVSESRCYLGLQKLEDPCSLVCDGIHKGFSHCDEWMYASWRGRKCALHSGKGVRQLCCTTPLLSPRMLKKCPPSPVTHPSLPEDRNGGSGRPSLPMWILHCKDNNLCLTVPRTMGPQCQVGTLGDYNRVCGLRC